MHIFTSRILDVSNAFKSRNVIIHDRLCVSLRAYYVYCFEKFYPNFPLNQDDGPFCLKCVNGVQGKNPAGRQCNRPLDLVVIVLKYKKIIIDPAIYINVSSYGDISYFTVFTDDVLNHTNNETAFIEFIKVFEEV